MDKWLITYQDRIWNRFENAVIDYSPSTWLAEQDPKSEIVLLFAMLISDIDYEGLKNIL